MTLKKIAICELQSILGSCSCGEGKNKKHNSDGVCCQALPSLCGSSRKQKLVDIKEENVSLLFEADYSSNTPMY